MSQPRTPAVTHRLHVRVDRVVLIGTALFALWALVAFLVPTLHADARQWWPWVGVAGAALGLVTLAYLRRGRGNAAGVLHR